MKNIISGLNVNTKMEVGICTYHLKTIFLWACESIDPGQWRTTEHWTECLFLLIEQLQNCVKTRFLPAYFIPECNLLDGLQYGNIVDKFMEAIQQFRLNPLRCATIILDLFKFLNLHLLKITENSEILLELRTQDEDSSVDREIGVYLRECEFFESIIKIFKLATIKRDCENPMISRMSCHILAAYANWCKDEKLIYSNNELFSLLDIIILIDIHGLEIPLKQLIRFVKREPYEELCIFLEFQHSIFADENCPSEDFHVDWLTVANDHECSSWLLLSLFAINSGKFRIA